jgi:ribosomal protein S18 acetylase RimI-like enzyme
LEDESLSWRAEAACRAAWPAIEEIERDGWRLRFAAGHSHRANSANPLLPDPAGPDDVLSWIDSEYKARGLAPTLRLPELIDRNLHAAFEATLARRGYVTEGESLTLLADLPPWPVRGDPDVLITTAPDADWLAAQGAWRSWDPATLDRFRAIVSRIAAPAGFMMLFLDGNIAAMAMAGIHDGILSFNSMITDPAQRGRGHGKRLLGALLAWGIREGASAACLQVEADNAPALALYRAMGFTRDLYCYRYWVKGTS